jgi:hypothetical protein
MIIMFYAWFEIFDRFSQNLTEKFMPSETNP